MPKKVTASSGMRKGLLEIDRMYDKAIKSINGTKLSSDYKAETIGELEEARLKHHKEYVAGYDPKAKPVASAPAAEEVDEDEKEEEVDSSDMGFEDDDDDEEEPAHKVKKKAPVKKKTLAKKKK